MKTSYNFTSPGEWRAVTPAGIARVRRPRREGTTWVNFFVPLCLGSMLRSVTRRRRHRF